MTPGTGKGDICPETTKKFFTTNAYDHGYSLSPENGYFCANDMPYPSSGYIPYLSLINLATGKMEYAHGASIVADMQNMADIAVQINKDY